MQLGISCGGCSAASRLPTLSRDGTTGAGDRLRTATLHFLPNAPPPSPPFQQLASHRIHAISTVIGQHGKPASPASNGLLLTCAQPAFLAINVEPEDNVVEEVDTTKDLQVGRSSVPRSVRADG